MVNMSKKKARVVCPIFIDTGYPYHGFGFKMGDPTALTYKFYATKNLAFSVDAGSAASGLYNQYHRERFEHFLNPDTLGENRISYLAHVINAEWVLEGKVFWQIDASRIMPGMQWYIGGGLQYRFLDIRYDYLYEFGLRERETDFFERRNYSMGPVVVAGLEYSYFKIPVSAFLEIGAYFDTVQDPGWTRFQGGVGIRYVF